MTARTIYLDRAILGRCVVCERRINAFSIWVGSGTVTEWEKGKGDCTREADMLVCSDECLGLHEAGEKVPA